MSYRQFVKANYDKFRHLPANKRLSEIAKLWASHKAQGGGIFGDIGSAVDGVGSLFGLGLEKKKKARKSKAKGAGIFGDIGSAVDGVGSLFGLGLEKQKKKRVRKSQAEGAGIFGDIGSAVDGVGSLFGLGLEKKKKRNKKNSKAVEGAGIFDDILDGVKKVGTTAASLIPAGMAAYGAYKGMGGALPAQRNNVDVNNINHIMQQVRHEFNMSDEVYNALRQILINNNIQNIDNARWIANQVFGLVQQWAQLEPGHIIDPEAHAGALRRQKAKGAGIFSDIGHGVDSVGSLFGLGLKKNKKNTNAKLMELVAQHKKALGGSFNPASLLPLLALF